MDHREDFAGVEFFLSLWFNDLTGVYYVIKATVGEHGYAVARASTRAEAKSVWRVY